MTTETTGTNSGRDRDPGPLPGRSATIRLILIPLVIWAAWVIETFLLEGNRHLYSHADPDGLVAYTIIACVLTGIIVPVFIIRRSFITGDVNMFQIGFRTPNRTITACLCTIILGYAAVILWSPFGMDRIAFGSAFLLLLPTAMASSMICWVLVGTHVQAYVRDGGSRVSIPVGIVVTAVLFTLTSFVHSSTAGRPDAVSEYLIAGLILAAFFFSVRDVYATAIATAGVSVFLMAAGIDTAYLGHPGFGVIFSALITFAALACVHWYLFRHYTTIMVPVMLPAEKDDRPED